MSKRNLSLAAALASMAALALTTAAQACKTRPAAAHCTVVQPAADVRDAPDGRVISGAIGTVRVAGYSKDGLWARIEVPCVGFLGWIARRDIACAVPSASAQEPGKP